MMPNGECQIIGPDRSQIFDVGVNFLSLRHQPLFIETTEPSHRFLNLRTSFEKFATCLFVRFKKKECLLTSLAYSARSVHRTFAPESPEFIQAHSPEQTRIAQTFVLIWKKKSSEFNLRVRLRTGWKYHTFLKHTITCSTNHLGNQALQVVKAFDSE